MSRPFVVITTRLPPAMCGIGGYSALLRKHWPGDHSVVTFLVVGEAAAAEPISLTDTIVEFGGDPQRLGDAMRAIGTADVLLHYAGRAYDRLGCPRWLPRALAQWKREFPESRLMLIVHELPGRFPITSRHFWLGKINERIVKRLATLADVLVTNTENHARVLRRISGRDDVQLLPVPSNIEVISRENGTRTATQFVLFGLPFGRLQTLQLFDPKIREWISCGLLEQLHLIGPVDDKFSAQADELIASWPQPGVVTRHGVVPAPDVSRLLTRARFALTNITPETWSKSTAFMAAAAHRCAVVRVGAPVLSAPLSFTVLADEIDTISNSEVEKRAAQLRDWYQTTADWPMLGKSLNTIWSGDRHVS